MIAIERLSNSRSLNNNGAVLCHTYPVIPMLKVTVANVIQTNNNAQNNTGDVSTLTSMTTIQEFGSPREYTDDLLADTSDTSYNEYFYCNDYNSRLMDFNIITNSGTNITKTKRQTSQILINQLYICENGCVSVENSCYVCTSKQSQMYFNISKCTRSNQTMISADSSAVCVYGAHFLQTVAIVMSIAFADDDAVLLNYVAFSINAAKRDTAVFCVSGRNLSAFGKAGIEFHDLMMEDNKGIVFISSSGCDINDNETHLNGLLDFKIVIFKWNKLLEEYSLNNYSIQLEHNRVKKTNACSFQQTVIMIIGLIIQILQAV